MKIVQELQRKLFKDYFLYELHWNTSEDFKGKIFFGIQHPSIAVKAFQESMFKFLEDFGPNASIIFADI